MHEGKVTTELLLVRQPIIVFLIGRPSYLWFVTRVSKLYPSCTSLGYMSIYSLAIVDIRVVDVVHQHV